MPGLIRGFKGLKVPTGVSLNASTASVGTGATYQLVATITPSGVKNNKIHRSASNNKVTVDSNGLVTGVSDGEVTVTATTDYGGFTDSCTFTVYTINVTGVSLNESEISLGAGDTYQLEATITPSDATNKNVTWRSTDASIATVDNNGLVTCVTPGECQIIVTTVDGNYTASCDVVSGYIINENTLSYFPFEEDFIDKKGNRTLTVNDCVIDNGSAKINSQSSYMQPSSTIGGSNITISVWYYYGAYSTGGGWNTLFARNGGTYHHYLMPATSSSGTLGNVGFYNNGWYPSNTILSLGNWYNIIIVKSGTNEKIYINGELVMDSNSSFDNNSRPIGMIANYQAGQTQGAQGRMSELIFEQGNWDATKVKKYFNSTKKNYFGSISDYQELEYIESDGNARINTQIRAGDVTKINIDLSDIYQGSSYADSYSYVVFGTTVNSWWMSSTYYVYNGARFRYHLGDGTKKYFDCNATQTGVKNSIEYLSSSFTVNGNSSSYIGTDSGWGDASNGSICIRHCGNNSYSRYKLYYLKITERGIEHEYIPVQRKSDGVLGLYDKATGIFYINAGSGNFTAGPRIGITLSSSSLSLTQAGQTAQLTVTPNPASVGAQGYQWRSSDTTIATVNSSGLVTCVTPGECVITCTAVATGDTDTCKIGVANYYFTSSNFSSFQSLVDEIGSVQFIDTGNRFRFNYGCYIGNRIAVDVDGGTFRKINLDTLTVISSKSSSINGRIWYFGNNRILTSSGIIDFDGNVVTSFGTTYTSIVPGDEGVVWANSGYDIYKGVVNGDSISFTKIGTSGTDQGAGNIHYGNLGAYLFNGNDTSGSGLSAYVNPSNSSISNFGGQGNSRQPFAVVGADGKMYRFAMRNNGWGRLQKVGTGDEGLVGSSLSTSWLAYGSRFGKFLGNVVSGGMNGNNGTGNGYGSNNYFISTNGTLSLVQSNAFAYDTNIYAEDGFIDEKGRIYPRTAYGGSGVILKTDKTFTNLDWKNPYLYR